MADGAADDPIEFAFSVGSAFATEVKRLQGLVGERDKAIQDAKEEKEGVEECTKSLRAALHSQEQSSDRSKEENWNLEVALQDIRMQLSHTQSATQRLESEREHLMKLLDTTCECADLHKNEAERTMTAFDELRTQHDAEFAQTRKHAAGLQRDISDLQSAFDVLKAKANRTLDLEFGSVITPSTGDTKDVALQPAAFGDMANVVPDPSPPDPFHASNHPEKEVEVLQQRLFHAERQIKTLKGSIRREKELCSDYMRKLETSTHIEHAEKASRSPPLAPSIPGALHDEGGGFDDPSRNDHNEDVQLRSVEALPSAPIPHCGSDPLQAALSMAFSAEFSVWLTGLTEDDPVEKGQDIQACDIAPEYFSSTQMTTLLLIKAVVLFMAGKYSDAISRIDKLIDIVESNSTLFMVQAYMYLLLGNLHMKNGGYEDALQSFKHARVRLHGGVKELLLVISLITGWKFDDLRVNIERGLCEALYATGRATGAAEAILKTVSTFPKEIQPIAGWVMDFKSRCVQKLEEIGNTAMDTHKYDEAIPHFTLALSLDPITPQHLFIQRSRANEGCGLWEDALNDANQAIKLDPSSPLGYERKHSTLHGAERFRDAVDALERMLEVSQSSNPDVRDRFRCYISPTRTKEIIHTAVKITTSESPPVLINTQSGRLLDKSEQESAFESQTTFWELISSTTTDIDQARIEREVTQFYRYATFSHKWENHEPLYDKVTGIVVYDLEELPTHKKLQMFCKTVREAGFHWAWSDTCCINRGDHFVLQEALVSIFRWYQGSAMTIVFLLGVPHLSERGALMGCIWNMRGWTLQEYHASKVVRFYTEDWTPYLNLTVHNHKESPEIISEMEEATRVSARALMALRPGLGNIREKLRLASTRQTTRAEDAAYALLGIFSVSMPVTYGEGDKALGRLLAQLLTSPGDTSVLAWTGSPGSFNSCLPANIAVFQHSPSSHIPSAVANAEAEAITAGLRPSLVDISLAMELYDKLNELPLSSFAGQRMKLPCLSFKLGRVVSFQHGSERVFRAQTTALGIVEIKTKEDLSRLGSLYLIHPWIDYLLDRRPIGNEIPENAEDLFPPQDQMPLSAEDIASLPPPSPILPEEKEMRTIGLIARLRRPFGALLLTPTRLYVEEYRRVAPECLVTVRVEELTQTTLNKLVHSVRTLDVL